MSQRKHQLRNQTAWVLNAVSTLTACGTGRSMCLFKRDIFTFNFLYFNEWTLILCRIIKHIILENIHKTYPVRR